MSEFYSWTKKLCEEGVTSLDSLSTLHAWKAPEDYVFSEQDQKILDRLKELEQAILQVMQEGLDKEVPVWRVFTASNNIRNPIYEGENKELVDEIVSIQNESGIWIIPCIDRDSIRWDRIKANLFEKSEFSKLKVIKEVGGEYSWDPCYYIIHHSIFDEYLKIEGVYNSYDGMIYQSFDEAVKVVKPVERIVLDYAVEKTVVNYE